MIRISMGPEGASHLEINDILHKGGMLNDNNDARPLAEYSRYSKMLCRNERSQWGMMQALDPSLPSISLVLSRRGSTKARVGQAMAREPWCSSLLVFSRASGITSKHVRTNRRRGIGHQIWVDKGTRDGWGRPSPGLADRLSLLGQPKGKNRNEESNRPTDTRQMANFWMQHLFSSPMFCLLSLWFS